MTATTPGPSAWLWRRFNEPLLPTTSDHLTEPGWETLLCPQCGYEYTHVNSVSVVTAGGDRLTLTAGGEDEDARATIKTGAPHHEWSNLRRHMIIVRVFCEDGCVTDIPIVQHKGNTSIAKRPVAVDQRRPDPDPAARR